MVSEKRESKDQEFSSQSSPSIIDGQNNVEHKDIRNTENTISEEEVPEKQVSKEQVPEKQVSKEQVSEEEVSEEEVPEKQVSKEQVSEEGVSEEEVPEKQVSKEQVSEEEVFEDKSIETDKFMNSLAYYPSETTSENRVNYKKTNTSLVEEGNDFGKLINTPTDISDKMIGGPEQLGWQPKLRVRTIHEFSYIYALGDLHGWAPGLITYLTTNQLAKIYINDLPLFIEEELNNKNHLRINHNNLKKLFPNPIDYYNKSNKFFNSSLRDFRIKGDLMVNDGGYYHIKAEWIGPDDIIFIQMGDIFDRADYSELAAEILRQLVLQAPLQVFILMGNHEQFLLQNDYYNWVMNENKFAFREGTNNVRFHTRFHVKTYSPDIELNGDLIKENVFNRYRVSASLLYLSQFVAQISVVPSILNYFAKYLEKINVEELREKILDGGWNAYKYAEEFIETNDIEIFPGAITLFGVGNSVFIHSDLNAFKDINVALIRSYLYNIDEKFIIKYYSLVRGSLDESIDFPLLWNRGGWAGIKTLGLTSDSLRSVKNLVKLFQGVRNLIHGHTPTVTLNILDTVENYPISYLARKYDMSISPQISSVRVYMLDEGICPIYFMGDESLVFDPTKIPTGLVLDNNLKKYQEESNIYETNNTEWFKVLNRNMDRFKINWRLSLFKFPDFEYFSKGFKIINYKIEESISNLNRIYMFNDNICVLEKREEHKENNSISCLLYYVDDFIFSKPPKRLYLMDISQNIFIDNMLLDHIKNSIEENNYSINNSLYQRLFKSSKSEINQWYKNIFEPQDVFGKFTNLIKKHGVLSLFKIAKIIYIELGLDIHNHLYSIVLNASERDIYLNIKSTSKNEYLLRQVIKKNSFKGDITERAISEAINWGIHFSNIQLNYMNSENIISLYKSNQLREKITKDRLFGGICWFSSNKQIDVNKFDVPFSIVLEMPKSSEEISEHVPRKRFENTKVYENKKGKRPPQNLHYEKGSNNNHNNHVIRKMKKKKSK
ncbi:MAG: metallophosphoesterase [Promethearchaeota archaeon]